ncbi:MAG TPA: hypothetical protein DCF63_09545 [Planctomycetaceae bacterium]|nr:hypothetical protein [Planctomycetaceae bacterium]
MLSTFGCGLRSTTPFDLSQATYVGSSSCLECHRDVAEKHAGSHHDLALQVATPQTVLANFNNATLQHYGITSRMYRQADRFMVQTEGPDGQMHDYQVTYVFGVTPLQQYLVEFPSDSEYDSLPPDTTDTKVSKASPELPRVQVLPLCWDTLKRQWFYLDPPDVHSQLSPRDDLHWTGIAQRWNTMCAECHSTNYQKNFSPGRFQSVAAHSPDTVNQADAAIGQYRSTFHEINVNCEACHGPASVHVELSKRFFPGWNRQRGFGLANLKRSAEDQIQACAPCHSRRGVAYPGFDGGDNFYDHYQLSLLEWPLYYPDGQVLDEDYIHGSFIQSKMYHKGIRCTDCHDPHTAKLKQQGNQVCTSCHQHPSAIYDSPAHHFHAVGSPGAACVNCHMPTTTYMQVDPRHDHSLRIPRPDVSLRIGTPNACTSCHLNSTNVSEDKRPGLQLYQDWMQAARDGDQEVAAEIQRANQWCDDACNRWYGDRRRREPHWGEALDAAQKRLPTASAALIELLGTRGDSAPVIARATALNYLATVEPQLAGEQAVLAAKDEHPLVRASAAGALIGHASHSQAVSLLEASLQDTSRIVRMEAARSLLQFPDHLRSSRSRPSFLAALTELKAGLDYNSDRAGSHLTLGSLAEQLGNEVEALQHYQTAIVVEPASVGPRTNLAAMLNRRLESQSTLPEASKQKLQSDIATLRSEELQLLARDVQLLPQPPAMLVFRYGLALYLDGQLENAAQQIVRAAKLDGRDVTFAQSAVELFEKLERWEDAQHWALETVRRATETGDPSRLAEAQATQRRIQQRLQSK